MEKGFIHIYTGNGKGKTTAALGLALRAIGAGKSVYLGQFIKKGNYSEIKTLNLLSKALEGKQKITAEQFGTGRFIKGTPDREETEKEHEGFEKALTIVRKGEYDLIILDEAVTAHSLGLITDKEIKKLFKSRNLSSELILTGRGCSSFLAEKADLVSEIKEIKHYYSEGTDAREGIEF